jgi:hypothetical protein
MAAPLTGGLAELARAGGGLYRALNARGRDDRR